MPDFEPLPFPEIRTSSAAINRAYRIAMGDLVGNVRPFQDGLLDAPQPVILAGLDYDTPWTRDASINVWNGLGLVWPEVSRNTLLAVLERKGDRVQIGGQYWDAILWTVGAWAYYCDTGDRAFLEVAFEAVKNSLARFEREEFDPAYGLFRGPAVYGDGVAAYPDRYSPGGTSSILDWVQANPGKKAAAGFGIPMMTLSTNCVYAQAFRVAGWMAEALGEKADPAYREKAVRLANQIQRHFWNTSKGSYNYLVDAEDTCDFQEGLGHAFALLFGLANDEQAQQVLKNQFQTPFGVPCVWPSFSRYTTSGGFGRHSGTVLPFISGFWGEAALNYGRPDLFEREFEALTTQINRHGQCAEIYHPFTGEVYGGLQEAGGGPDGMRWSSCTRQSWTASAYLRLILNGLCGMRFAPGGISFQPYLPASVEWIKITGLSYRTRPLSILIEGTGGTVASCTINGTQSQSAFLADTHGEQLIQIRVRN